MNCPVCEEGIIHPRVIISEYIYEFKYRKHLKYYKCNSCNSEISKANQINWNAGYEYIPECKK